MLRSCSLTDIGQKRTMNQDFVFTSETAVGKLHNLFVVADGMGGHNAGDIASKYTVEQLILAVQNSKETEIIRILEQAIKTANYELRKKAAESTELQGMGTTLVVASIYKNILYIANVGDSRLYVVGDEIIQITRDHSLVEEMVRLGELDKELAKSHPDKNIITRAIGANDEVKIDVFEYQLKQGDIILMCSDGLSNMMDDYDIYKIMSKKEKISDRARKLIDLANNNGGRDNIAVVIIEPIDEVNVC